MRVRFTIEEGQATLASVNEEEELPYFEPEDLWMAGELEGELVWATDCPAYDVDNYGVPTGGPVAMNGYESGSYYIVHGKRCDCNWWPVIRLEQQ